ncbi:hypothetical protein MQA28_26235, partial [Escherichia coli]|nr:hypothetical protein [Escherichia coli]
FDLSIMLRLVILVVAVSCAYGQLHSVCHSNTMQMTEAQVIHQIGLLMDRNRDRIITEGEIVLGFRDILNGSLPLSDETILAMDARALLDLAGLFGYTLLREEFVIGWTTRFHDSVEFVEATFDAFDTDGDGELQMSEVEGLLELMVRTSDANGDRRLQESEFEHFFTYIYSC